MNLAISKIRIDGGTQARVSINEMAVAEYAEALTAGELLPPVTAFHDGAAYWLADGFHRYHAHLKIGALKIDCEVRNGTLMDALLYAYGANREHGLRRSNADKRKAVEGMLANFVDWSDNRIAKHVGVSQTFVGSVRQPEVAANQQANREKSAAKKTMTRVKSDLTPAIHGQAISAAEHSAELAPTPPAVPVTIDPEQPEANDEYGPSPEELAFFEEKEKSDQAAYDALIEVALSDDKLGDALQLVAKYAEEIARLKALVRTLEDSRDGKMNAINEHIRTIKSLRRKIEQLEKAQREAA